MANPTWLNLKEYVANQLGSATTASTDGIFERVINQARREYYSYRQWSFLKKTATLNFTAQVADVDSDATDYNRKFDPIDIYKYIGTVKYQFSKVAWADVGYYSTDEYVYAIDKNSGQIKVNTTDATLSMDYTHLPADRPTSGTSEDSQNEAAPDITPIGLLAIAKWWLSSERGTGKYQLFKDEYNQALAQATVADAGTTPVRPLYPRKKRINSGYVGR